MVIAKQINKLTGRKGRVFNDRYHARVLRSPTEVMLSRRYILNNFRKHLAQRLATERTQPQAAHICVTPKHLDIARQILAEPDWIDPYSSAGRGACAMKVRSIAATFVGAALPVLT